MAVDDEVRWVARLTPPPGRTVQDLLQAPVALDVWERQPEALVAAATEASLKELERRRLAGVERLCTTAEHEAAAARLARPDPDPDR